MSPIRKYLKNLQKKAPPKRGGILKKIGFQAQNNSIFIIIRPCTQASQAGIIGKPVRIASLDLGPCSQNAPRIPMEKSRHYSFNNIKKGTPYRFLTLTGNLFFNLFTHPSLRASCFNLYKKLTTKILYICALQLIIFVLFNLSLQHLRAEHEPPHIQNQPIPYMPIFERNPFHCMRRGRRKRIRPSRVRLLLHDHLGI